MRRRSLRLDPITGETITKSKRIRDALLKQPATSNKDIAKITSTTPDDVGHARITLRKKNPQIPKLSNKKTYSEINPQTGNPMIAFDQIKKLLITRPELNSTQIADIVEVGVNYVEVVKSALRKEEGARIHKLTQHSKIDIQTGKPLSTENKIRKMLLKDPALQTGQIEKRLGIASSLAAVYKYKMMHRKYKVKAE